jgi:hypothetical protein
VRETVSFSTTPVDTFDTLVKRSLLLSRHVLDVLRCCPTNLIVPLLPFLDDTFSSLVDRCSASFGSLLRRFSNGRRFPGFLKGKKDKTHCRHMLFVVLNQPGIRKNDEKG